MTPELRKVALFFGTTLLLGVIAVVMAPRFLGAAAGPEAELVAQLARTECVQAATDSTIAIRCTGPDNLDRKPPRSATA